MKRETREWLIGLAKSVSCDPNSRDNFAGDALATDAEVKRLRRLIRWLDNEGWTDRVRAGVRAALKPRKEKHLCWSSSSDEQVLCDDPKCPRSRYFKGKKR